MISGHGLLLLLASLFVGWVTAWIPLHGLAAFVRPDLVALSLIYWSWRHPERFGVLTAWWVGVISDLVLGSWLGVHALAYALMIYFFLNIHHRFRIYPMLQQSVLIFLLVGIAIMVIHWINQLTGVAARDLMFMLGAIGSALCWPFVRYTLDYLGGKTV
ncbi:MAG: rod shape-determining protein MreD [Gammaproteobacteria bacterium]|nr:MAG: rod shape-determining protein MreD [Gammaproteobacteria bacterium]